MPRDPSTVFGSRRRDRVVFLLLAFLVVAGSWRLRVYYRAPPARAAGAR